MANNKRKASSVVPTLIDNKRKHLERQLNAAERDRLLINDAKEEAMFRKEMINTIKESNATFLKAMESFSNSMSSVAGSLAKAMDNMAKASSPFDMPSFYSPAYVQNFQDTTLIPQNYNTNRADSTESQGNNDIFGNLFRNSLNN